MRRNQDSAWRCAKIRDETKEFVQALWVKTVTFSSPILMGPSGSKHFNTRELPIRNRTNDTHICSRFWERCVPISWPCFDGSETEDKDNIDNGGIFDAILPPVEASAIQIQRVLTNWLCLHKIGPNLDAVARVSWTGRQIYNASVSVLHLQLHIWGFGSHSLGIATDIKRARDLAKQELEAPDVQGKTHFRKISSTDPPSWPLFTSSKEEEDYFRNIEITEYEDIYIVDFPPMQASVECVREFLEAWFVLNELEPNHFAISKVSWTGNGLNRELASTMHHQLHYWGLDLML
jgi:hypothetical protein